MQRVLVQSLKAWFQHRAASKGAALAFYTLFSMTPILLLAMVIAGYFFGAEAAQGEIIGKVQVLVGQNGAMVIQAVLASARNPASGALATVLASVLILLGATSVFVELKGSLDEIWSGGNLPKTAFRRLLRDRILAFLLVLLLAFLVMVSLMVGAVLAVLERYVGGIWSSSAFAFEMLSSLFSFGVIVSLFAVIFKMLPDAPLSWRDAWTGAFVTALLFSLGRYVIGLYMGGTGAASGFGAAGSVVALLLWIYYSAQIFFLGAEFTRQFALHYGSLSPLLADKAISGE